MTDNFQQFSAAIGRFKDHEIPQKVQDATAKIGLQALRGVVMKTPIDTGRARGNWQVSLDQPSNDVTETLDPSGQKTIQAGSRAVLQVRPFGSIWLSNNLPYARPLEEGHSGQAPNGMVAVTATEIQSQFRRIT